MKSLVFVLVSLFFSFSVFSQSSKDLQSKKLFFGIYLGFNQSNMLVESDFVTDDKIINNSGFSIGTIADIKLTNNFNFSPKLAVTFGGGNLKLVDDEGKDYSYHVVPISLDFMGHFILKKGRGKFDPYLFVGPNYKKTIQGKNEDSNKWATKSNLAVDFGVGVDMFFKRFIIAPELRYSYGLVDVNTHSEVNLIKMHHISLAFVFKG